jgi:hypothetical protein
MKKFSIVLILAALVAAGLWFQRRENSRPELEVVCYARTLVVPEWTPLSMGFMPGETENPTYIELNQMRHLVMIVSVPAGRLQPRAEAAGEAGGTDNSTPHAKPTLNYKDDRYYPSFMLTTRDNRSMAPLRISAWPNKSQFDRPEHFQNPENWYPAPGEKPKKRFNLALYWRLGKTSAMAPFQLQMDELPPVVVEQVKNVEPLW